MKFYRKQFSLTILFFFFILLLDPNDLHSQSVKINSYLKMIAEGKIEYVKKKLPELITEFGDEPGVILLQGVVLENASRATPYYKQVLEKFPNSEWAPHAAWRMIQYYSIVLDTASAKKMLAQFRLKYPTSPFLAPAADAVSIAISDAKYKNREKYLNPPKEEVATKEQNTNETPALLQKEKYGLQVGIYSTKAAAESERDKFVKTAKLRAEVLEKLVLGEKKYAVVIGNYDSEEEAIRAKAIVEKQCKCNPLVYKK